MSEEVCNNNNKEKQKPEKKSIAEALFEEAELKEIRKQKELELIGDTMNQIN